MADNKVTVRPALPEDGERIAELLSYIASYHAERRPDIFRDGVIAKHDANGVRSMIADDDNIIFAAISDGKLLGYTISKIKLVKDNAVLRDRKIFYIDDFCVDPSSQRLGIGRALFASARDRARELGCDNLELNVWECNAEAIAFYEACGMTTQRRQMEIEV